MKKVKKFIYILILIFISLIFFEMISISTKYVNRSTFNIDINNVRIPVIKKLIRKIDNFYAYSLLKLSKKHQEHLNQQDKKFEELPKYKTISAKKNNFTISNFNEKNNLDEWKRSHGNHSSNRFSNLSKINLSNIKNLDLVWKYEFSEINRDIQANPVIANGKIFTPTTGNNGENWTNNTALTRAGLMGDSGGIQSILTSHDQVTMTIGATSVTATITVGTAEGNTAITNIAARLVALWNAKYSTSSVSGVFSYWTTMSSSAGVITAPTLKSSLSGSRAFDDTVTVSFTPTTAAKVSSATSGTHTTSRIAWRIGASDATTDNGAVGNTIIVSVEETVAGNGMANRLTGHASLIADGTAAGTVENNLSNSFGLVTNLISVGSSAVNTGTTTNIFPSDARGDVVVGVTANAGTTATTGTARTTYTRLHWLG